MTKIRQRLFCASSRRSLHLEADVIRVVYACKSIRNHIDLAYLCEAKSPVGKLSHKLLGYT